MRRRGKIDVNQNEIVEGLRKFGATVCLLSAVGGGAPDLLVGYEGNNFLIEIKSTVTSYGRNGLNDVQILWHQEWKGQVCTVYSLDEALAIIQKSKTKEI